MRNPQRKASGHGVRRPTSALTARGYDHRRGGGGGDRREIAQRIEWQVAYQVRIDRMRRIRRKKRIAVGRRLGDKVASGRAGRSPGGFR